jgi:hypothetical protein
MPEVSIISHFYNHPDKVLEQIAWWESLPVEILSHVEFILVDDCSEQSPVIPATGLDLRVFRITTNIAWNQPGARNLATFHARGAWGLYFDLDQRFHGEPMSIVLNQIRFMDDMTLYHFRSDNEAIKDPGTRIPFHPNTYLVNIGSFKTHGMYDEDFSGSYGYDDIYMAEHWERGGGRRQLLADFNFFTNLKFDTARLDRDASHNRRLGQQKLLDGARNSAGMLRFAWEPVAITRAARTDRIAPNDTVDRRILSV